MEHFSLRKVLVGAVLATAHFGSVVAHPRALQHDVLPEAIVRRDATTDDSNSASTSVSLTSLTTSAVQTASPTVAETTGSVNTALETSGNVASQPFATNVDTSTSSLSVINTETTTVPTPVIQAANSITSAANLFSPMASGAPPSQIATTTQHPVARLGIVSQTPKLETNKFYANFFLGTQGQPSFTYPYSVFWPQGAGGAQSWGLAVSHIEQDQLVWASGSPPEYFINPGGIQSMVLSAVELGNTSTLTTDTLAGGSVNVKLNKVNAKTGAATTVINFPLVQGQGFISGHYNKATPLIQSSVAFLKLTFNGRLTGTKIRKYTVELGDYTTWVIYVKPTKTPYAANKFTLVDGYNIQAPAGFTGLIQVAKIPSSGSSDASSIYDAHAGVYATSVSLSGSAEGTTGTYTMTWKKAGNTKRTLAMFALPHHLTTLQNGQVTDVVLRTPTKGDGTLILADSWTFVEDLPTDIGFAPWSPSTGSTTAVSDEAKELILAAAESELSQNIKNQADLDSMYYSGKALAKFAAICYATHDIAQNTTLAYTGLQQLEAVFGIFVNNEQIYPLIYESAWGGIVSSASYVTGNSGVDFGNTYYNDHHFHYGYFIYAAAVIGYLDPDWLNSTNVAWVNSLIRDYANPSASDPYFPFSRMFDWYHGHSWAAGLFEAADGKNQESSSEDSNSIWAMKLWGAVNNDTNMEARAALMMAVQARSLQNYFLYTSDNTVEPSEFIPNKVSGILFDNKIDHTTYFGTLPEYIEGIHMLPLQAFSALTRTVTFVTQEWNTYFSGGYAATVAGGWRGILYANRAISTPAESWAFFSNTSFDMSLLDGGASLTWYRAYSAALGGSTS